jgi:hypothetical protein
MVDATTLRTPFPLGFGFLGNGFDMIFKWMGSSLTCITRVSVRWIIAMVL